MRRAKSFDAAAHSPSKTGVNILMARYPPYEIARMIRILETV
jgi:hypothetical protein